MQTYQTLSNTHFLKLSLKVKRGLALFLFLNQDLSF